MKRMILFIAILLFVWGISGLQAASKIEVFDQAKESVVKIKTFSKPKFTGFQAVGQGSGYVIDPDGYIITNYHVVEDALGIIVYHSDNSEEDTLAARVIVSNEDIDIAVLKVEKNNMKALKVADSADIRQGQEILVLGYPAAAKNSDLIKVTWGIAEYRNAVNEWSSFNIGAGVFL